MFERLERASRDPLVKAVVLRLDTPGGEVTASDIVYHEVLRFKGADGPAGRRADDERRRLGRLLHRRGLRRHRRPPVDADRQHRRHLRLPQRRGTDVQGRGQGHRGQVRTVQGLGLALPRYDGGGPEGLPGHHRRVLRGVPGRRGPRPGRPDPGRQAPGDRRRPRLYGPPGPQARSHRRRRLLRRRLRPGPDPGQGPGGEDRLLHLFPQDEKQHLRRASGQVPLTDAKALESVLGALKTGFYYLWLPQTK
ncbi:MAG: hypothetical protein MZV64_63760 [Ignavibacteriales bacterium]|nr:hypothetical protein [Ignavibacteriales bacterium]